jgi:hypothetical protein
VGKGGVEIALEVGADTIQTIILYLSKMLFQNVAAKEF